MRGKETREECMHSLLHPRTDTRFCEHPASAWALVPFFKGKQTKQKLSWNGAHGLRTESGIHSQSTSCWVHMNSWCYHLWSIPVSRWLYLFHLFLAVIESAVRSSKCVRVRYTSDWTHDDQANILLLRLHEFWFLVVPLLLKSVL